MLGPPLVIFEIRVVPPPFRLLLPRAWISGRRDVTVRLMADEDHLFALLPNATRVYKA